MTEPTTAQQRAEVLDRLRQNPGRAAEILSYLFGGDGDTPIGEVRAEVHRIALRPNRWELRAQATGGPCRCGRPFWTHVCLSCSPDAQSPGRGCGGCRQTGMDQTPCIPLEKQ